MGRFSIDESRHLIISYMNQYNESDKIVTGLQFYEIYDSMNILIEKRYLEINFKPVADSELRSMIKAAGLEIVEMYGDYSYGRFDGEKSNFMIYKMTKN